MTLEAPSYSAAATSLDRVFEALDRGGYKPEKRSNSFKALCPIHGDAKQSLSVKYDSSAGKILFHCFGCEAPAGEIAAALGLTMSDLFDAPLPDNPDRRRSGGARKAPRPKLPPRITRDETAPKAPDLSGAEWHETKVYPYPNAEGVVVQRVHRRECVVDGIRHKEFHQTYRGANGNWVKNKPKSYEPLFYNLPAVLQAVAAGGDVWILEGEKDADSAIAEGLTGTTNAGGAISEKQLPTEILDQLRGATVRIVADNDAAGAKRVVYLSTKFTELGITHHIYLPTLADRKADFTDHLDAGGTVDTLIEISIDDARTMIAAAESERLVTGPTGVAVCLKEATAQLESKLQDRGTAEQHAEAWARESLTRFEKIRYAAPIVANETALTDRGREALDAYAATLREGAQLAADTYRTAGLDIPKPISLALAVATPASTEEAPVDEQPPAEDGPGQPHVVGGGGGGNGVFFGNAESEDRPEKRIRIIGSEYRVVEGETVLVKSVPGDGEGEWIEKYYRVMRGWAEVQTVAVEDDGTEDDFARAPHMIAIKFFRWLRDPHGKPIRDQETREVKSESVLLKYNEDQLRDGSWAQALPWPGFLETNSRRGRDQAWDAIFSARQTVDARSIVHTTVGWRNADTGPYFVHAAGAIAKGGPVHAEVDVDKTSSIYTMPEPTTDPKVLRQAWLDGTLTLKESELPARVIAPLLGHAWTAPVLPGPIILHLVGGFASYKSSHSRLPVQYFAPDLTYTTKGLISGASSGATAIALPRLLSTINHVPVIVDDFAPDGDAKGAIRRISALGRTIFNGIGRLRARQRKGTESDRPILASVITSGELSAQGSADSRIVNLPLDPATVRNGGEIFARLESKRNRHARATIGAALVRWIAERRDVLIAEFTDAESDPQHRLSTSTYWRDTIPKIAGHNGLHDRLVQSATVLDRGIVVMLMMLQELGVITKPEADEFYVWARQGIFEAMNLQDSAASDPAEQLLEYLREAIANGSAHLSGFDGVRPESPGSMGWTDQSNGMEPMWKANGSRLGVISQDGTRVYLFTGTSLGIANAMSQRADEAFSETKVSIASSLQSHGWLVVDAAGKRSVNRRIGQGMQARVWDIPLSALLGANDGGEGPDAPGGTTGGDTPSGGAPTLFDDEPTNDQPPAAPTEETPAPEGPAPAEAPQAPVEPAAAEEPAVVSPAVEQAPAAAAPKARQAPTNGSFRSPLGVLHTDGLWLPDGELVRAQGPLQHAGDLAQLAISLNLGTQINSGANRLRKTERGQIFLTAEAATALGLTLPDMDPRDSDYAPLLKQITTGAAFLTGAVDAGYSLTGDGAMAGSIDVWREDDKSVGVHIGLIPAQNDAFIRTILRPVTEDETGDSLQPDPATIARRLGRYALAMRFPYRNSAATTGIKLMTATHVRDDHDRLFTPVAKPPVLREAGYAEDDFNWQRQLTPAEREHHWVHAFDRGGSYLAAVAGLELGIGTPTHHEGPLQFITDSKRPDFNRLPGYWKITAPEQGSWLTPYLFTATGRFGPALVGTEIWIATPTMELAHELGIELEIHEAWLWHEKGRVLDSWYKRMKEARDLLDTADEDDRAARDLVKSTYVAGIGMLDYRGRHDQLAIWAPHRHDHIVAKSRANILRRILQIGEAKNRWPVAIEKDAILYTSDSIEGVDAWPGDPKHFGRGLGQFKYEATAQVTEHLEFLTGSGPYRGKSHMQELI